MTQQLAGVRDEWFAIQVWTGREQLSARHLRQRGYRIFLPCYGERRPWSDRMKTIERALFPGYVFCQMQPTIVAKILGTPGVMRIVGDGSRPLPVPDHEVETIQRIVETRVRAEPWPFIEVGQRVRIEAGALKGMEGIVLRTNKQHRLVVSIPLLQRSVAVEIDPAWVSSSDHDAFRTALRCG